MALTRAQLDHMTCGNPDCTDSHEGDPLFLHSECHPGVPTWAEYENGELKVTCAACGKQVAVIAVRDA